MRLRSFLFFSANVKAKEKKLYCPRSQAVPGNEKYRGPPGRHSGESMS